MPIITISRGSYSRGISIAEKVAENLGYNCISREVLIEASKDFNIPEVKLVRALHDAPSILERFTYGREKYLAFIESAILEKVRKDNVVYHGLAGHFFLGGVAHVLKVRIIADFEDRVRLEMEREKISRQEAIEVLRKDDHERREWSRKLYGIDTHDPSLYDMVLHIHQINVEDAVTTICHVAKLECFQATPDSRRALSNLVLAARVKVKLVEKHPSVTVSVSDGIVYIRDRTPKNLTPNTINEIKKLVENVPEVKEVRIELKQAILEV